MPLNNSRVDVYIHYDVMIIKNYMTTLSPFALFLVFLNSKK